MYFDKLGPFSMGCKPMVVTCHGGCEDPFQTVMPLKTRDRLQVALFSTRGGV